MYKITDSTTYNVAPIPESMFGLNFVLTYDMEFLEEGNLLDLLGGFQAESLRYPGGSITEIMFEAVTYGETHWAETYFETIQGDLTQRESMQKFVKSASEIGADIQLVLPTRIAFEQTTGQAIAAGNYGTRTQIDPEYFTLLGDYIDEFIETSIQEDVNISRFEIGNEFWGSGRMTASEYGYLAAEVTQYLSNRYPLIDVIAQVSYNAGVFSPVEDTNMYLTENGDDFNVHFDFQDLAGIEGLQAYVMPGQGSGVGQTQQIGQAFADNPTALANLDGIVDHVYFRHGFDGIDDERNHALITIPQTFKDSSGLDEIDAYITEWSVRNISGNRYSDSTNHLGLQYASSTLEAFFELIENDVVGANFWPVTFGNENIDRRVLIDTTEQDYTFGGEIFRLLSSNVVGLQPVFDFEVEGKIDTHGFSNDENLVFFVSERSGQQNAVEIDFSEYGFDGTMFLSFEYLGEDGDTGTSINSNPIISSFGGGMVSESIIALDLSPWSLAVIRAQNITDFADRIQGTELGDNIRGEGGDDNLFGASGDDQILGNLGHDFLDGGAGNDTLKGGWGNDTILGGSDNDAIFGTFGENSLNGQSGDDVISGGAGNDIILGGAGNDTILVNSGENLIFAGEGDDEIRLGQSAEAWGAGSTAVNVISSIQAGTAEVVDIDGFQQNGSVINGGAGYDTIYLSASNDAFFLDDSISKFHTSLDPTILATGVARIRSIEEIHAGDGNDIIDLTSGTLSLSGEFITIDGGLGNDTLWGSDAHEVISGGDGEDVLFGGAGRDILVGGSGADVFEFNIFGDNDTISDFSQSEGDMIHVYGATGSIDRQISWDENRLKIQVDFSDRQVSINIDIGNQSEVPALLSEEWLDFIQFIE